MQKGLRYVYNKANRGSIASKALSIATLAGLMIFGANTAQSEEISTLSGGESSTLTTVANGAISVKGGVTGFAAELTPTLDGLHTQDPTTYPNGSVYKYTDGSTANNWAMGLKPDEMSSSDSIEWTKQGSAEKDFTFDTSTKTGSGVVSVSLPKHSGTSYSSTVGYYTYEYTAPTDYTVTSTRLNDNLSVDNVDRKIFTGISSGNNSGAIYNTKDLSTTSIISDFINNTTSYRAGAIYNSGSTGTITGNFIANKVAVSGVNKAYGGAIYNSGSTGVITGNFIKNFTRTRSGGYGGAIYNKSTSGEKANITSINADFIGNQVYGNNQTAPSNYEMSGGYAISSSVAGGGIYNGGNIGDIVGDFIGNNAKAEALDDGYNWGTLGAESYGGAIYNSDTINSIIGDFINNSSRSEYLDGYGNSNATSHGGAIYNSGTISAISGDFHNNKANAIGGFNNSDSMAYGGAIYNSGSITTLEGNFSNNTAYSYYGGLYGDSKGGAIYNSGTIDTIIGDFTNNKVDGTEGIAYGGAIYNEGTIGNITGNFNDNTTGYCGIAAGIYNTGNITSITGDFIGNTSDSNGGAIYNIGTIDLIEGSFINNYGGRDNNYNHSESYVGGAIYTTSSLNFNSSNGRNSVFSGNTAFDFDSYSYPQAIFVDSNTATLTFNADENSSYTFDDYINGLAGYNVIFKGDNTGVVNLYNDIKKGAVTVAAEGETLTMNLANDTLHDYDIGSLDSNSNAKWYIDVDVDNQKADRLITSIAGSTGYVTLHGLNVISGDFANITDENFKIQVLKTQDDTLQLALSDAVQAEFDALDGIHIQKIVGTDTYDPVQVQTLWSDIYNKYTDATTTDIYGRFGLTTTDTTNDSIGFIETGRSVSSDITPTPLNTLTYVNQSDIGDRTFKSSSSSETYTVTENPGITGAGEFSIIGIANGENRSTLDLNGYKGFELENAGTTLTLKDLKVTGGQDIATSTLTDSVINLNNVDLSGNGAGITTAGNINVSGNSFIGDNLTLSDKNGTLSVDGTDKVTFDGTTTGVKTFIGGIYTNNKGLTYNADTNMITSSTIYQNENGEYMYNNYYTYGTSTALTQIEGSNLYRIGNIVYNPDIDKVIGGEYSTSMNIDLNNTSYTMTPVDGFEGAYRIKEIPYIYISQVHVGLYYAGVYDNTHEYSNTTYITERDGDYYYNGAMMTVVGGTPVYTDLNLTNGEVTFTQNAQVVDYNINLDNVKVNLEKESSLDGNDLNVVSESTLNTVNNTIGEAALNKVDATNPLNWDLDVDLVNRTGDTISTVESSTGEIALNSLNSVNGRWADITDPDFKIQLLKTPDDNLQLTLSSALSGEIELERSDEYLHHSDPIKVTTNWDEKYYNHMYADTTLGVINLATTDTTNDSIGVNITGQTSGETSQTLRGDTLALVNQANLPERNFNANTPDEVYKVGGDSAETVDMGTTGEGILNVNGVTDGEQRSTIDFQGNKGFTLGEDTTINFKDVKVTGATQLATSNTESSVINLDNTEISGNDEGITTSGTVNVTGSTVIGNDITLSGEKASLNIKDTDTTKLNAKVTGTDSTFSVTNSTLDITHQVSGVNTVLDNSTLNITNESLLTGDLTVTSPSKINIVNDNIGVLNFNNVSLNDMLTMTVEVDLANEVMDRISANTAVVANGAGINVSKLNLLSPTTKPLLDVLFTDNSTLASSVTYTGESETVYSPIYKYQTSYIEKDNKGYFRFATPSIAAGGSAGGSSYTDFNPAVLASPVSAQAAAQGIMNYEFNYAFEHADGFMPLPATERMAMLRGNQYAINDVSTTEQVLKQNGVSTDYNDNINYNSLTDLDHTNKAIWVKPYTGFERINLHNGPKVDMISYGTLVGADSDFRKLKNGWANVGTLYLGYNGASIDYSGVDSTFNGGVLGITETFYKNNFFTAITANVGAGFAEASTMYGKDDITMLMAGIASKTGYNFEFKEGKFIIQPNLILNYSMINTFDYKNAAGVKIKSDPLHTIQLNPNIKFIANLKHEWQPYASVGMVYNLMNETNVTANGVKLPESSTRPYVEYGIGVQKHFGETFSGYGQAMVRNGGRNGIVLTAGFRWALGGKNKAKKDNGNVNNNKKIKEVRSKTNKAAAQQEAVKNLQHLTKNSNLNNTSVRISDSLPKAEGRKIVAKSDKQGTKYYNIARYKELIGE